MAPSHAWNPDQLAAATAPLRPDMAIEVVEQIDSSNTELMRRGRAGQLAPVVLVAERQTAGRGRQGRHWKSALGESLTFSLSLPLAIADWSGLSLAVGVALCEAVGSVAGSESDGLRAGLKWPNDIWLMNGDEGRKLGGVLIETVAAGARRPGQQWQGWVGSHG